MFRAAVTVLAATEPNTSYRNPISLEKMLLDICLAFWHTAHAESEDVLRDLESRLPVEDYGVGALESPAAAVATDAPATKAPAKRAAPKGAGKAKKRGADGEGNTIVEPEGEVKPKPRRTKKAIAAT
jgi:hypothetical protein